MNTSKENWESRLNNLHTRTKGISSEHQINYKQLLKDVFIGVNVLDVGCGTCWLKDLMPLHVHYTGLDAWPNPRPDVIHAAIEEYEPIKAFDTVFVFAALDGMRDLELAFKKLKLLATKNIVILTGVEIEPDLYHTHKITEKFIADQMDGWYLTHRAQVHPKIVFLEYTRLS